MQPTGMGLVAILVSVVLCAAEDGGGQRDRVPADTLPTPLVRTAPLGAEEFSRAWTASEAEVTLGRRLFFEPSLSRDRSLACASCHRPRFGFADDRRFSRGIDGQEMKFNSPSIINKGLSENLFWNGRAATIEEQVLMPIENPRELGLGIDGALGFLSADSSYSAAFQSTYGGPPTRERLANALAAFLRALVVANSPVDRFRDGEFNALNPEERAGLWIYEGRGGCWRCHSGPNFSDEDFHNTGIGATAGVPQQGRSEVTVVKSDFGKFRTPGLRLLTKTAPYMHDGSLSTLEDVVEFYRKGGEPNSHLSEEIKPLELTDEDARHLTAFLRALSR